MTTTRPPPSPARHSSAPEIPSRAAQFKAQVDVASEVFTELLEVPTVNRATFLPNGADGTTLQLDSSHRSTSQTTKRSATQSLALAPDSTVVGVSPIVWESDEVLHSSYSPDGMRVAVFRKNQGKDKDKQLSIEIVNVLDGVKEEEIEIGNSHGEWYFDSTFGGPSWHPDGTAILYVAQPKPPSPPPTASRETYEYTPDFGELFSGKKETAVFLLCLKGSPFHPSPAKTTQPTLHRMTDNTTFPDINFGQPIFVPSTPKEKGVPSVLATGYKALADGRKLGIVYCTNRPAAIYQLVVEQVSTAKEEGKEEEKKVWKATSALRQSPEGRSARSPRLFMPPNHSLVAPLVVFISNPEGKEHNSCATLHAVSLKKGNQAVLVGMVDKPDGVDGFPGLYVDQLPLRPFVVLDGIPHVALTSYWRSRRVPLLVSLATGEVKSLAPWPERNEEDVVLPYLEKTGDLMSYNVLGTDGGKRVVASRSGPGAVPEVVVRELGEEEAWKVVKRWRVSQRVENELKKLDWTVVPLPKFEPSEIVLISPIKIDPAAEASISLPPLVTIPHGGPHSAYGTDFTAGWVALAIAGYRVALVNYPGSIGFGQACVEALAPEVGKLDVEATLATSHYLNTLSLASRAKGSRLLMGGSHGGFIATHLSGSYPEEYDAVVLRNPVTDLPSMFFRSDIPDWCLAEAALSYTYNKPTSVLTPTDFAHLHSVSPLTNSSAVTAPTLLLVGEGDRRVPPDQARAWYHALKRNGTEVNMLVFPGNGHAIDSDVASEMVGFETGLRWLERFTVV